MATVPSRREMTLAWIWVGAVELEVDRLGMYFRVKYPESCDFLHVVRGERERKERQILGLRKWVDVFNLIFFPINLL